MSLHQRYDFASHDGLRAGKALAAAARRLHCVTAEDTVREATQREARQQQVQERVGRRQSGSKP